MDNAVSNIINCLLSFAAWISSLMIIYGGVKYILARGNKEKETRAGKMFISGLVVLLILAFLYAISLTAPAPPLR